MPARVEFEDRDKVGRINQSFLFGAFRYIETTLVCPLTQRLDPRRHRSIDTEGNQTARDSASKQRLKSSKRSSSPAPVSICLTLTGMPQVAVARTIARSPCYTRLAQKEAWMRLVCMICFCAVAAMAQAVIPFDPEYVIPKENPYTSPADLNNGQRLFLGQCARCHSPKGEGGRGAVLAQPRLRHAPDDESLFLVIRDGIKGTEMPAGYAVDTRETWQLAAYVRSLGRMPPETVPGDPKRGQELYRSKGTLLPMSHHWRPRRKSWTRTHRDRLAPQRRPPARGGSRSGIHATRRIPRGASSAPRTAAASMACASMRTRSPFRSGI